jgi:AcrR family transcriptional regulator
VRENKKELILDIAAKHFSRHGFDATSLEEVASDAGVTKPAIYYHFKDKSALYESVLLGRLRRLAETLERAVEAIEGPREKLRLYIEMFGAFLERNDCFAAILLHEFADNGEHMPDAAVRELARTLGIVTTVLNEGVEAGVFSVENPMVVQMMIVSPLITHQTTRSLRGRVTANIRGDFRHRPEPNIEDFSKILARNILKTIARESR